METQLEWKPGRGIPVSEFVFTQDTSAGPGGQHANRSQTRVTLSWDFRASTAFSDHEKQRIAEHMSRRIQGDGVLQVRSQSERSQRRNKDECLRVLASEIRESLKPRKRRVATKPTRSSRARRVDEKKKRAQIKRGRQKPSGEW